ncbi:hypothetical protein GC173_05700 [bacterium]|nr:hypothetical protein [bacterium]
MKVQRLSAILFSMALVGSATAQYGLLENYEGTDRYGNNVNLNEGANFTYGGASGGGEGPVDVLVMEGSAGFGWGTGGALTDGFGIQAAATAGGGSGVIDLTQTVNGLTNTGYTIKLLNIDAGAAGSDDGNVIDFIVEDDTASPGPGQEIFTITGLQVGTAQTLSFTAGTGVAGPNGTANRARFKQFIVRASNLGSGGNTNLNVDNIGFLGNLVPTSLNVENFDAQTVGGLATGQPAGNANVFGGDVRSFVYGGGAITGANIVSVGAGDNALELALNGLEGGVFFDLGPETGSQADVSAATGLSFKFSADDAAQQFTVFVETPEARGYGDRSAFTFTPGTALTTIQVPFSSLVSGAQGFSPARVQRITFVPSGADAGTAGVTFRVDDVKFYSGSSVADWTNF